MFRLLTAALLLLAAGSSRPAQAAHGEARACVNQQVSDLYAQGWRLRTVNDYEVEEGDTRYTLLTLTSAVEYQLIGCSGPRAEAMRLVIYDDAGREVLVSEEGRQASITFTPERTGAYFVGVKLVALVEIEDTQVEERRRRRRAPEPQAPTAGLGLGVVYN